MPWILAPQRGQIRNDGVSFDNVVNMSLVRLHSLLCAVWRVSFMTKLSFPQVLPVLLETSAESTTMPTVCLPDCGHNKVRFRTLHLGRNSVMWWCLFSHPSAVPFGRRFLAKLDSVSRWRKEPLWPQFAPSQIRELRFLPETTGRERRLGISSYVACPSKNAVKFFLHWSLCA